MNVFRANLRLRTGLLLVALLSWFAFSNRCALGQLLSSVQSNAVQHECCDKTSGLPGKVPLKTELPECCKALDAISLSAVKAPVQGLVVLATVLVFDAELNLGEMNSIEPAETGPPGTSSFTELVLHRSLRSHAPPICA